MAGHPLFAALYDRILAGSEDRGLRELRDEALGEASGRVLEIGAGTGLSLSHYTTAVSELVLTEPDPHMARRLRARIAAEPPAAGEVEVIEAAAEELPFGDASFDHAVSMLTLCTVDDLDRALAEVRRVLKPGGRLHLLEHVRDAEGTRRARWQDRLARPWGVIGAGCHPNRRTGEALQAAGFELALRDEDFPGSGTALVRPMLVGSAQRQAG